MKNKRLSYLKDFMLDNPENFGCSIYVQSANQNNTDADLSITIGPIIDKNYNNTYNNTYNKNIRSWTIRELIQTTLGVKYIRDTFNINITEHGGWFNIFTTFTDKNIKILAEGLLLEHNIKELGI
jgi:hypothetical protein